MRFGMPVPDRIANAPELDVGLGLYYNAFLDLTSSRPSGMGLGAISYLMMAEYCVALDFDAEQRDDLLWILPRLDAKYLGWSRNKSSGSLNQPAPPSGEPPPRRPPPGPRARRGPRR